MFLCSDCWGVLSTLNHLKCGVKEGISLLFWFPLSFSNRKMEHCNIAMELVQWNEYRPSGPVFVSFYVPHTSPVCYTKALCKQDVDRINGRSAKIRDCFWTTWSGTYVLYQEAVTRSYKPLGLPLSWTPSQYPDLCVWFVSVCAELLFLDAKSGIMKINQEKEIKKLWKIICPHSTENDDRKEADLTNWSVPSSKPVFDTMLILN